MDRQGHVGRYAEAQLGSGTRLVSLREGATQAPEPQYVDVKTAESTSIRWTDAEPDYEACDRAAFSYGRDYGEGR